MGGLPMDNTVLGIILGAVASGFVALIIAYVSKTRGQDSQRLEFSDMLRAIQDENREALEAVKSEVVGLRDTLKDWTEQLLDKKLKDQRKQLRREIRLSFSEHKEDCRAWRDSVVNEPAPFSRSTTVRGIERIDSDTIDSE